MKLWALGVPLTLLFAAAGPLLPAAAATGTTLDLVSGGAPVGSPDPNTVMSLDDGWNWSPAVVTSGNPAYSTIPGTAWVSDAEGGQTRPNSTTLFRRVFDLPAGTTGTAFQVCVETDNAATITLNGTAVGQQPNEEIPPNYQDPAECYTASAGLLVPGHNTLQFTVHNFTGPTGLDYHAVAAYQDQVVVPPPVVNTPPVLHLPAAVTVDATGPLGAVVSYTASATDDGTATVACTPASGSTFAIGTSTVTCTATDDRNATTTGTFTVTVRGARDQLSGLSSGLATHGVAKTLIEKILTVVLQGVLRNVPAQSQQACGALGGLLNYTSAQPAWLLPPDSAAWLIDQISRIRAVLSCR